MDCPYCKRPMPTEAPPGAPGGRAQPWARDIRFTGLGQRDPSKVNCLFTHESVTDSIEATVSVLRRRKCSVHFMIGPDGPPIQTAELGDRCAHAGGHNGPSVGLEIVNRYYPEKGKARAPWGRVISAPWADDGIDSVKDYVLPTISQMEHYVELVEWLTSPASGLSIPRTWPGVFPVAGGGKRIRMGLLPDGGQTRAPGIWAHHYANHADGAWPVLVAWLTLEKGWPVTRAYDEAERLAAGAGTWISLP